VTRRKFLSVLNATVALVLALFVIWSSKPWTIWEFEPAFITSFAFALVFDAVLVVIWAFRHSFVLRAVGASVSPRRLVPLVTFSNTANNLTPAASGEVMRVWFLKERYGVPIDRAGGAIVFERLFMFGLMAGAALTAGLFVGYNSTWPGLLSAAAVIAYVLGIPAVAGPLARRFRGRESTGGPWRKALTGAANHGIQLWGERSVSVGTALWSILAFACQGAVFWLAASISDLHLGPLETWALVGGGTAAGVLSALPFGLGVAEISAAGIGIVLGLDGGAVAAAFVLYRLFLTFPLALAGSYSYWRLSADNGLKAPG
jgi:uncharacterized membrane protein YbhN (UPF0104 family)